MCLSMIPIFSSRFSLVINQYFNVLLSCRNILLLSGVERYLSKDFCHAAFPLFQSGRMCSVLSAQVQFKELKCSAWMCLATLAQGVCVCRQPWRQLGTGSRAVPLSLTSVFLESINRLHSPTCSLSKT